jgi:DNA recombination protein Rad52
VSFTPDQIAALQAPLDRANVATRTQSGRSLSYIEGWHAIAEANRIFGFHAWTRETLEMRMVAERERAVGQGQGYGVSYLAKVRVTVTDGLGGIVTREGYGTGHGIDRDLGLAHESAAKEAETDAMKRALMTFGNPFGLALYDKTQAHVADTPQPPAKLRQTPAQWVDGERKTLDAMLKRGDVDGIMNWPASVARPLARLADAEPDLHQRLCEFHADVLAQSRAAG